MPKLQFSLPDGAEIVHEFNDDLVTVGRVPENTIVIADDSVSSRHAELSATAEGGYVLTDLGSTNGTRVNGEHLPAHEGILLKEGDSVRVGNIHGFFGGPPEIDSSADNDSEPMPEADEALAVAASSSVCPEDFQNASPFPAHAKSKGPAEVGILVFGATAILVFLGALAVIFTMKSPV